MPNSPKGLRPFGPKVSCAWLTSMVHCARVQVTMCCLYRADYVIRTALAAFSRVR